MSENSSTAAQQPEEIDPRDNLESQGAESTASHTLSRGGSGGAVPSEARPADAVPGEPDPGAEDGTAGGNPLEGVEISAADAQKAVPGDEGPEHPGQR